MIHYHGVPINPEHAAAQVLRGRHGMVPFSDLQQISLVAEVCQSFVFDNGAYTAWQSKTVFDKNGYAKVVRDWSTHPGFDWALIPDVIDGAEAQNDELLLWWEDQGLRKYGVPVWHLHESVDRLVWLADKWNRVALGSSGEYAQVGTARWWNRMAEAMNEICIEGKPITKLHGLRMLAPKIFCHLPLSSADSTNVALHVGEENRWNGGYKPPTKAARGIVIADRIEAQAVQEDLYAMEC